jgi:virginiamycin B lyase
MYCCPRKILGVFLISIMMVVGISHFLVNNETPKLFEFVNASTTLNSSNSIPLTNISQSTVNDITYSNSTTANTDVIKTLTEEDKPLLCGDNVQNSNLYFSEFVTPILCSQPVGLAIDRDNNIWIASGKSGSILIFDTQTQKFDKIIKIPNWPKQERNLGSMIWEMKFDRNGDLWFTDELSNSIWKYFVKEGKFENYRLLQEGGYPLSIAFDSDNNVWFTQVFGQRLGFLEPSKVINNTTEGISELDMSKEINFQTMGPISNGIGFPQTNDIGNNGSSNVNETLWFSTSIFPVGGQLIKYDIPNGALTIHDVNHTHSVPFSIAEDENGLLWFNSHIANLFLSLDPKTGATMQYATSNPSKSGNLTTLPYVNIYSNGKVWFNEHYGNAIASYDPKDKTLIEYYIPSKNPLWVNSSNPLRFILDNNGSIWFTEWTENKLGVIPKEKLDQIPITLSISKDKMNINSQNKTGDAIDIFINKNIFNASKINNSTNSNANGSSNDNGFIEPVNVTMSVTSSISKDGNLGNLTSNFSHNSIPIKDLESVSSDSTQIGPSTPYKITLEVNPTEGDITPGNYTLTITARYGGDIAISKIVDLVIQ